MATKTLYLTNTITDAWQILSESSPGADATTSPNTGWTVAKIAATRYSPLDSGAEQGSGTFLTSPVHPNAALNNTTGDAFRAGPFTGTFAAGNWTFNHVVRAVGAGGSQDGRIGMRMWRGTATDATGATQITSSVQVGATVTNLATTADQNSSITYNPGALTLSNEYLWFEIAWEITGAGGNNSCDVIFRIGDTGTRYVTTDLATAAELNAETGSFTETGANATLSAGRMTNAGTGSFALTGNDATFAKGFSLNLETGSFTETGADASFALTWAMNAAAGSFAIGGQAATLTATHVLALDTGSIVLTGAAATLSKGYSLNLETGGFTETGTAATLTATREMNAAAGSFATAGSAATLTAAHVLALDTGSIVLTGVDATLVVAAAGSINAEPGAFVLTGADAELTYVPVSGGDFPIPYCEFFGRLRARR